MSIDPSDLSDQAGRARRASGDMFDSLDNLGGSMDREEDLIDDLEREIEEPRDLLYDVLEQTERDYRRVEAFADKLSSKQERLNERLADIDPYSTNPYSTGNNWGAWQTGNMRQQQTMNQGIFGQQQGFGQNNFWGAQQQGYGQQQQQRQGQSWDQEFFGAGDEDVLSEEQESSAEPVDIDIDGSEGKDYDDSGEEGYEPDDPDGSVDMSDNWNPDASFDYEAEQSTENVTQSLSFSGSGFEPSGNVTMEQSAGGETQYFEASF